jgi:hypothetical protein
MLTFKETEEIVRRWESILPCVINKIESFADKTSIALCFQAQVKLNEKLNLDSDFRRWSIPILVRAFKESKAFKRNHFTNFVEGDTPNIAFLKTRYSPPQCHNKPHNNLEHEAELVAVLAQSFKEEIDDMFRDRKNVTIVFHGISHTPQGHLVLHYS